MSKCCGTCRYSKYDKESEDYTCQNPDSEDFADWTESNHVCDEYERNTNA